MVNWDPGSRSAISDLEVENREVEDVLYSIDYPVEGSDRVLTVATVRPETMLADTAVAVNPDDGRYADLVGQRCVLPLVGRRLPIIADEHVDPEFGTGALKITPGHDVNDFEIGRRHGLEEISVIGEDGRMNAEAGEYAGLTIAEAQAAVVEALRAEGRLRAEEPYAHSVPFSHRSGERIEPLISLQWFCRMDELARPAIEVVERDEVRIAPEQWKRVYLDWMREIRPWCVSRQLWWGHRIPVWYCDACEETYRRRGGARALRQLRRRAAPGGGRARHLVQLGDLAVRDARLARRDARAARLLPDQLPHHRPRDPLPLGGADDHDRDRVRRRRPLPRRLRPLGDPGPRRAADVEEPRHRDRPARGNRRARRRRAALRPAGDVLDPGRALLRRQGRAGPRPRQQALERRAIDPAELRIRAESIANQCPAGPSPCRGRARDADPGADCASRTAGSSRGWRGRSPRSPRSSRPSTSPTPSRRPTRSSGATSATGTWRSSSRGSTRGRRGERRLGDRCSTRWNGCWRCCTRRCRSSPRRSGPSTRPAAATSPSTRSRSPTRRSSTTPPRTTSRVGSR